MGPVVVVLNETVNTIGITISHIMTHEGYKLYRRKKSKSLKRKS